MADPTRPDRPNRDPRLNRDGSFNYDVAAKLEGKEIPPAESRSATPQRSSAQAPAAESYTAAEAAGQRTAPAYSKPQATTSRYAAPAPKKRSGFLRLVVIIAVLAVLYKFVWPMAAPHIMPLFGAAPGTGTPGGVPGGEMKLPVGASKVKVDLLKVQTSTVGTLESNESVTLSPEIDGKIVEIHFEEGQAVKQGDLLISMDAALLKADLDKAAATLEMSEKDFTRSEKLFKTGSDSERRLDEARMRYKQDKAAQDAAQAMVDKTSIRAPFDGIMGLRQVSVGEYVKAGEDLVNIEAITPLKVDFQIPEKYSTQLHTGQTVELLLDSKPNKIYEGSVYAINPKLMEESHSIAIRARIENGKNELRPGMFARIRINLAEKENTMFVPEAAIVPVGSERFVFAVRQETATYLKVETGERQEGMVEILSGLNKDDVVITDGQMKVQNGMKVMVISGDAAQMPPSAEGAEEAAPAEEKPVPKRRRR